MGIKKKDCNNYKGIQVERISSFDSFVDDNTAMVSNC